jgi:hypothetical protein
VLHRQGVFRVKVYAPIGDAGGPALDLTIKDPSGETIVTSAGSDTHPRRVEAEMSPGPYVLEVRARSSDLGRLQFDLMGELDWGQIAKAEAEANKAAEAKKAAEKKKAASKKKPAASGSASSTGSASAATAGAGAAAATAAAASGGSSGETISIEVLGVEEQEGRVGFVLLDAGEPDGVSVGMRGEIEESGTVLGTVVVVEVFSTGSRAAVVGELSGDVGFEARVNLGK